MPHRNVIAKLFTLPIAALLWVIGWSLFSTKNKQTVTPKKTVKASNLTIGVLIPEAPIEA
jgi:hypothetical protein